MKRFSSFSPLPLLFLSFFLLFPSCGKKGPIYPPLSKIPKKVEIFEAVQKGKRIILEWKNPESYLDGASLLEIKEVEIWMMEEEKSAEEGRELTQASFSPSEYEKRGKLVDRVRKERFAELMDEEEGKIRYHYELSPEDLGKKRFTFSLRIRDKRDRESDFSELISVEPIALPPPPLSIKARVFEEKIEITWIPPQAEEEASLSLIKGYNVYRREEKGPFKLLEPSLIKENKFEDRSFSFGKNYEYCVRVSASDSSPFLESDDSEIVRVLAEDKFPPSPPSGLVSISGKGYVTLSWEANKEEDLAGYKVWRREEGEKQFKLLTSKAISGNAYTDTSIEKRKRYHYAITAIDRNGNESEKSEFVSETIEDLYP